MLDVTFQACFNRRRLMVALRGDGDLLRTDSGLPKLRGDVATLTLLLGRAAPSHIVARGNNNALRSTLWLGGGGGGCNTLSRSALFPRLSAESASDRAVPLLAAEAIDLAAGDVMEAAVSPTEMPANSPGSEILGRVRLLRRCDVARWLLPLGVLPPPNISAATALVASRPTHVGDVGAAIFSCMS